jgi:predicted acyltransferase
MKTTMCAESSPAGRERLMSLDVFRGATMAAMLLVNNPGDWDNMYSQLDHAAWNGWTFTDLIFPFFLWIVGAAIPLSMGRRLENGEPRPKILGRILRRSAIIIALGVALNGFPQYDFHTIRYSGVLQRIGVCYLFASLIFITTGIRGQAIAIFCLLAGYWLLMAFMPVPGWGHGILDERGNFSEYVDSLALRGHTWRETKTYDPEGIVSTLPAIATVLFGIMAGHLLRSRKEPAEKTAWLFVAGNFLLLAGLIMNHWLPINKKLWTSTYAVFMAGMAANVFGVCYWLVDVKGKKAWARPLAVYGMNAITVFVLTGLLGRISTVVHVGSENGRRIVLKAWLFGHIKAVFEHLAGPLATPKNSSLIYALMYVVLMYGVAWVMCRRKWFVRI